MNDKGLSNEGVVMLPIGELHIHPNNIRKEYKDIEELADSIRSMGVLQNLTVAKDETDDGYCVLIGNRRLLAAKEAGVMELPCVISEAKPEEQMLIMATENMQRTDLTPYEEGKAFEQMTLAGLGMAEICSRTGLSRTTIKSRLELAKLDPEFATKRLMGDVKTDDDTLFQITLKDVRKLEAIEDIAVRNDILQKAKSSANLQYLVDAYLKQQKEEEILDILKGYCDALKIPRADVETFSDGKTEIVIDYSDFHNADTFHLPSLNVFKENIGNVDGLKYSIYKYYPRITLYRKRAKKEKSPAEILESMKKARKREIRSSLKRIAEDMRQFVCTVVDKEHQGVLRHEAAMKEYRAELTAAFLETSTMFGYDHSSIAMTYLGMDRITNEEDRAAVEEFKMRADITPEDILLLILAERVKPTELPSEEPYYPREKCLVMQAMTLILTRFGYSLPDRTAALLDGTDELYKTVTYQEND